VVTGVSEILVNPDGAYVVNEATIYTEFT